MLHFLDKNDLHKLKILQLLNDSNNEQTLDSISSHFFIDKRTVQSLITYIQSDIQQMHIHSKIKIEQRENGVIFFHMSSDFTLQVFLLYYFKKSVLFIFCRSLYNSEFTTSSKFAKDNYISLSTFKNKLVELRNLLDTFDLQLNLNSNYPLIGDEKQIRHFYFYFFWTNYQTLEWPFKEISMEKIKQYLDKNFIPFANFSFSDTYKILIWLSITIMRIKKGFYIDSNETYTTIKNKNIPFSKFYPLIKKLFHEFDISDKDIVLREVEFLYFCTSLLGIFPIQNYTELDLTYSDYSLLKNPENVTHIWIEEFCSFFSLSISASEYQYLQANLMILFNKIIYLKGPSSNFNFFVSEKPLVEDYIYYFQQMDKFVLYLKKNKKLNVINQANHHLIEFYVLIVWEILFSKKEKIIVTIQSSFSSLHMNLLKKNISNLSKIPLDIHTSISKETLLIISDIPIPKEFCFGIEVFIWNTFPTKKQFEQLNKKLIQLYQQK